MVKVVGLLWIVFGLVMFHRHEVFRSWLRWRGLAQVRQGLSLLAMGSGISLILVAWPRSGRLAAGVVLIGLIALVKGLYILKAAGAERLIEALADLPENAYRWYALAYVAIGLALLVAF